MRELALGLGRTLAIAAALFLAIFPSGGTSVALGATSSNSYDSLATAATASTTTQIAAFSGYDDSRNAPRERTGADGVLLAAESGMRAESSLQGALLREHLRLTEKYGTAGVRELENGRIRYYGDIRPARTPGEMVGQRTVREWDPATGRQRTWLETVDRQGRVRIVRPETGGRKTHYLFDESGGYGGSR